MKNYDIPAMMLFLDEIGDIIDRTSTDYTPAEIGELVMAAYDYMTEEAEPNYDDRSMRTAFTKFKRSIDAGKRTYKQKVESSRLGGLKSALSRQKGWTPEAVNVLVDGYKKSGRSTEYIIDELSKKVMQS